jgi:hypothetical protein
VRRRNEAVVGEGTCIWPGCVRRPVDESLEERTQWMMCRSCLQFVEFGLCEKR